MLAADLDRPGPIAVDGADLYVAESGMFGYAAPGSTGRILKVAKNGDYVVEIASGWRPWDLHVDADAVFFTNTANFEGAHPEEDAMIVRVGKDGDGLAVLAEGLPLSMRLTGDGTHIYWAIMSAGVGSLVSMPKSGGAVTELVTIELDKPLSPLVVGDYLYWANAYYGGLFRMPKRGGDPVEMARPWSARDIAIDGCEMFWADPVEEPGIFVQVIDVEPDDPAE